MSAHSISAALLGSHPVLPPTPPIAITYHENAINLSRKALRPNHQEKRMFKRDLTVKDRVIALLDELPDAALAEVVSFVEFQRYKLH